MGINEMTERQGNATLHCTIPFELKRVIGEVASAEGITLTHLVIRALEVDSAIPLELRKKITRAAKKEGIPIANWVSRALAVDLVCPSADIDSDWGPEEEELEILGEPTPGP